ncbi:MAG: hypothetical protein WC527_08685 [Candidatus Margulisiibacteriota bacterium]
MQKLINKKITIAHKSGQNVSGPLSSGKGFTLFSFFTSSNVKTCEKDTATLLKEPVLKSCSQLNTPRADLIAVKNWVALEEKIVHDYKGQKAAYSESAVLSPKSPAKQLLPAFETFATQTVGLLLPNISKLKNPLHGSKKVFSNTVGFLLVCGLLVAGAFIPGHVQETFSDRETTQKLLQLQSKKEQQRRSYAELKDTSENRSTEMKWLNSQLHDMTLELKTTKTDEMIHDQDLEKKYREELMKTAIRYESELAALRDAVQTQNAIVNALKTQSQAFEKIISQTGAFTLSGATDGLSQEPLSAGGTSASQGEVISVNKRQGFVVLNMGVAQGARPGRWITISRGGLGLAVGRVDRVYPTMSVAMPRTAGALQVIQEGDSVSFS